VRHAGTHDPWLRALRDSALDVITTSLGREDGDISAMFGTAPHDVAGSYMPLVSPRCSLYVGWTAGEHDRGALARAFLGMGEDESLAVADVEDAMGELVNILGGGVKRRMLSHVPGLSVGLPFFAGGRMRLLGGVDGLAARVRCGASESHIVFYAADNVNPGAETAEP
jgi:hypothetical protein